MISLGNWLRTIAAGALVLPLAANAQDPEQRAGLRGENPSRTFTAEPGDDASEIDPERRAERQDREAPIARPESDKEGDRREDVRDARPDDKSATLPDEFISLKLTDEEEQAVLRVIGQYDDQIRMLLDRFRDLHAQAIGIEAIPLAEKMRERGDLSVADQDQDRPQQRTAGFRGGDSSREQGENQQREGESSDQPAEKIKKLSQKSPMAGPAAETWRKLHALHYEMVQVEAQKLAAIEKLLPEGKLKQLHKQRSERHSKPERPDLQNANKNPEEERRDQQE